jgi:hypothetical protein
LVVEFFAIAATVSLVGQPPAAVEREPTRLAARATSVTVAQDTQMIGRAVLITRCVTFHKTLPRALTV